MSAGVYGGDEVGTIVVDVGSNTTRIGHAGEDSPKGEISTYIGVLKSNEPPVIEDEKSIKSSHYFDPKHLMPQAGKELLNPIDSDCLIQDWDLFEKLLQNIYKEHMREEPSEHPILMSEAPWNTKSKREKLTELMFETFDVPAFFLCKNAVLSAFAHGRSTGLVLDSGATHTSAVPVHDGYVLQQAIVKSPVGGDFLSKQCMTYLEQAKIECIPPFMIKSKESAPDGQMPVYTLKEFDGLTKSYMDFMKRQVVRDFQSTVLQVSDQPFNEKDLAMVPGVSFEFPHGHTTTIDVERFRISDSLFDTSQIAGVENTTLLGAPHVINTSIGMCDVDIRAPLYNSVIVVGGNTLVNGFIERLNRELLQKAPSSMRLKLVSNNQAGERRFSSWIGGSILGSLGSFQQLWISKQEYEEGGKAIVDRKCP